jgi:hypothetical protein
MVSTVAPIAYLTRLQSSSILDRAIKIIRDTCDALADMNGSKSDARQRAEGLYGAKPMRKNPYRFARNVVLYIALVWLVGQALSLYDHRSHANAEQCSSHEVRRPA